MEYIKNDMAEPATNERKLFHAVFLDDDWHVLFRHPEMQDQFVSVGRFYSRERAENYAEVENMFWDEKDGEGTDSHEELEKLHPLEDPPRANIAKIERKIAAPAREKLPPPGDEVGRKQRILDCIRARGAEGCAGTGPMLSEIKIAYDQLRRLLRNLVAEGAVVKTGATRNVRYYARESAPSPSLGSNEPPDNSPGSLALEALKEAGAEGMLPSALREDIGLEVGMFSKLMQHLLTSGVEKRAFPDGKKRYVLAAAPPRSPT